MTTPSKHAAVIINNCHGGFEYSREAIVEYRKRYLEVNGRESACMPEMYFQPYRAKRRRWDDPEEDFDERAIYSYDIPYEEISIQDPIMIRVVQDLGPKASGRCAHLVLRYVLNKYKAYIAVDEYDEISLAPSWMLRPK